MTLPVMHVERFFVDLTGLSHKKRMDKLEDNLQSFERDGFAVFQNLLADHDIQSLTRSIEALREDQTGAGVRNLLCRSDTVKAFAESSAAYEVARQLLQSAPSPVRAILFDKTPESNWYVTWHQDLSIPVKSKIETKGYGPWSVKDGIIHVQPPAMVLEQMVSLRVHLDACREDNGAIKFIPGSHKAGIFDPETLQQAKDTVAAQICPAERGDIIAMRPLILHSSSQSKSPEHRRVLHLEYAGVSLPPGLEWAQA